MRGTVQVEPLVDELATVDGRLRALERFIATSPSSSHSAAAAAAKVKPKGKGKGKDKDKDKDAAEGGLSELFDAHAASVARVAEDVSGLAAALSAATARLDAAEEANERHARALSAGDRLRRETEGDVGEELRGLRAKVAALDKATQRRERERERERVVHNDGSGVGVGGAALSGTGESATRGGGGIVEAGSLGAAAVDARLALLQSEKARLRSQLK